MKRLVLLFALLLAATAHAQPAGRPLLLAASPDLQGLYSRAALVAVPVGDGYLGFIVNRATEVKLEKLFPEHAPSAKVVDPVYFGGPVMADAVFAVVRRSGGDDALRLFGDVFLVTQAAAVDTIIERTPNDARYFAGFVGWQPGELAKEIEAGYWYVTDADPEVFFRDNESLWQELVERLGNGHAAPRGRSFQSAGL